ncbi:MAG: substrate-binding domain-containing protein [Fusicatenibacter saccharivorans]
MNGELGESGSTDAGVLLRRRAEEIIGLIDKTEKELAEQEALIDGRVTIGCGETRSVNVLADLIETFSQKYPNVTFDLVTGTADVLKEQMDRGLMDVALLLEPVDVGKYEFVRLKEGERQQVLMRPDDPLAQKEVVHPEDLKDLPLILPRRQDVQNEITNWFGAYYQKLNIRFTCNMPTNGAKMVRKGLGYLITVQGVSELWKEEEDCRTILRSADHLPQCVYLEKGTAIQPCCDEVYRSYPGKFVKTARK